MRMAKTYHQKQYKLAESSVCGGNQGKNGASAGAGGCWEALHGRCPTSKEEKDVGHRGRGREVQPARWALVGDEARNINWKHSEKSLKL